MAIDLNAIMAQAALDPSYLAAKGGNTAALKRLILGYGDSSALSPQEAALYGIQPGDVSAANGNQFGTVQQLQQQLAGDQAGITNTANAHGQGLFSGALAASMGHEQQAAGQRSYNAYQALQGQIAGIDQNNTNSLTGAYTNLANQALADQTIPAAPVAPVAPVAAPIPGTTPDTANTNVNPGGFNPLAPQNTGKSTGLTIKPPKPPKLATGYQGHA